MPMLPTKQPQVKGMLYFNFQLPGRLKRTKGRRSREEKPTNAGCLTFAGAALAFGKMPLGRGHASTGGGGEGVGGVMRREVDAREEKGAGAPINECRLIQ